MKLRKKYLLYGMGVIGAIVSFYLVNTFYPKFHPLSQTDFTISKEIAEQKAHQLLIVPIPENELEIQTRFIIGKGVFNPDLQPVLQSLRQDGKQPLRYWEVSITDRRTKKTPLSLSSGESQTVRELNNTYQKVRISPRGKLLQMDFEQLYKSFLRDSLRQTESSSVGNDWDEQLAKKQALKFLLDIDQDTLALALIGSESKQDSLGRFYQFTFEEKGQNYQLHHTVKLAPEKVFYYDLSLANQPEKTLIAEKEETAQVIIGVFQIVVFAFLLIFIIVYLIQLARQEFISLKIAMPMVYIIITIQILNTLFETWYSKYWVILVGVLAAAIFYGVGILLLYSVSDALARQQWPARLAVFDLFYQRKFFSKLSALGIIRGMFLGALSLSWFVLVLYLYSHYFQGGFTAENDLTYSFVMLFPALMLSLKSLTGSIFHEFFFRLYGLSLLKKWLKKDLWVILCGALIGLFFYSEIQPTNLLAHLLALAGPALLFAYFLIRFNIFTTIIGYFTFVLLSRGIIFTSVNESSFQQTGLGLYFVLIGMGLIGIITLWVNRKEGQQEPRYIPEYVKKHAERDRLLRELEIARTVQAQFLPKETPIVPGYQLAAHCIPAWEVGGDYFDYFPLSDGKLGVVIGDVSNKGISAAFFMTLVKGFLKALVGYHDNPAEVLCQVNHLFYQNVERRHFISMIYGILDPADGTFVFARAGHNPLLVVVGKDARSELKTPPGLAIGLADDSKFRPTIQQEKIQLQPGDFIVLFTDGYSEAMNQKLEEFGEENLVKIIRQERNESARKLSGEPNKPSWNGRETNPPRMIGPWSFSNARISSHFVHEKGKSFLIF
ncbi:MAG: hypothetical protein Kow0042_09080 [Calditrichia bacterium]